MDFRRPYFAPFNTYEDSPESGSPGLTYASHCLPPLSYQHYSDNSYRPSSFMSCNAAPLPDPNPFQLKHTTSELYRIDSGVSINRYSLDNSIASTCTFSDRHDSPPGSEFAAMSPEGLGDYCYKEQYFPPCPNRTTSMSHVQNFPDHLPEHGLFDPEHVYTMCWPQDAFVSSDGAVDVPNNLAVQSPEPVVVEEPVLRQRKPAARASTLKSSTNTRIGKRTTPRRSTTFATISNADSDLEDENVPTRPFYCPLAPYGCESTFGSKNEWKRHLSTQHLRLEYWRCDECPALHGKKPNDFNRRDLFTQHVRRMHLPNTAPTNRRGRGKPAKNEDTELQISKAADRCHRRLRSPPTESICVICSQRFSGTNSWDERMEHLGKHFEDVKKEHGNSKWALDVESWLQDTGVEEWMITHSILSEDRKLIVNMDESKD